MNKKILFLASLLTLSLTFPVNAQAQCGIENKAFKSGEFLSYDLYFNWQFVWVKVGTASMSTVQSRYKGQNAYRASLITRGNSKLDNMFVMRDTLVSYSTPRSTSHHSITARAQRRATATTLTRYGSATPTASAT